MIFGGGELLLAGSDGHGTHLSGIDSSLRGASEPVTPRPLPDHDRRGEGKNCIKTDFSRPVETDFETGPFHSPAPVRIRISPPLACGSFR
jgi:hypothetical protein